MFIIFLIYLALMNCRIFFIQQHRESKLFKKLLKLIFNILLS